MMALKINRKQSLKLFWILLSVAVLFSFEQCYPTDYGCYEASDKMLLVMFLLSFPGSLLFLISLGLTFNWVGIYAPMPYFLLWVGTFIVGYYQWFWLLPYLLRKPEMMTLGLAQSGTSIVGGTGGRHHTRARRRRKRAAWLRGHRVLHFDEMGRTPLERVINDNHI